MALPQFVLDLKGKLSPKARILVDPSSKEFQLALLRWSDINTEVPGAVIQVANELDAVTTAGTIPLRGRTYATDTMTAR